MPLFRTPDLQAEFVARIAGRETIDLGYERWINRAHRPNRISDAARRWEDRHCFVRRGGEMCFVLERL